MIVTIGGAHEKQAEERVLAELSALQQPLDKKTFDAAREAFLYHVASDTQTPQERADNLGWYAAEGNLRYAPGMTQRLVRRNGPRELDPAYVADIVRRYLEATPCGYARRH